MNPEHLMIMEEDGVLPPLPGKSSFWEIFGSCLSWPGAVQESPNAFLHLFCKESR